MPLPEYSGLDRASPPPPMLRSSSTLEKLISEQIPLKDILDGALDGSITLIDEIREAELARARLHSFIDSCHEEEDPGPKTVQEIGYYNTELREWTAQLAKLEVEMLALQTDIAYLNHALHTAIRRPPSTSPFVSIPPQQTSSHTNYPRDPRTLPIRPPTTSYPYVDPYASPYTYPQAPPSSHGPPLPATTPDMSSWAKGSDQYGRCTRQRREGRYHIILLAPHDSPERGLHGNRWTPAMGYESMRKEAEAEAEARKARAEAGW